MLDGIARFYYPRLTRFFPNAMKNAAGKKLGEQLKTVHDVKSMPRQRLAFNRVTLTWFPFARQKRALVEPFTGQHLPPHGLL